MKTQGSLMIAIDKYQERLKMIKRTVLASALIMASIVVSAEDDVGQKIESIGKLFV